MARKELSEWAVPRGCRVQMWCKPTASQKNVKKNYIRTLTRWTDSPRYSVGQMETGLRTAHHRITGHCCHLLPKCVGLLLAAQPEAGTVKSINWTNWCAAPLASSVASLLSAQWYKHPREIVQINECNEPCWLQVWCFRCLVDFGIKSGGSIPLDLFTCQNMPENVLLSVCDLACMLHVACR